MLSEPTTVPQLIFYLAFDGEYCHGYSPDSWVQLAIKQLPSSARKDVLYKCCAKRLKGKTLREAKTEVAEEIGKSLTLIIKSYNKVTEEVKQPYYKYIMTHGFEFDGRDRNAPIELFYMSTAAYGALHELGINTVQDLIVNRSDIKEHLPEVYGLYVKKLNYKYHLWKSKIIVVRGEA